MKKYLLLLFLAVFICPAVIYASNIAGADYTGDILASNDSSLAEHVSGNVSISTPDWVSAGIINSSATNIVARDSTGNDIVFMPGYSTNPMTLFCGNIPDSGNNIYRLYTGNVSGGDIRYFPGSTGLSVTDNNTIEPANNFSVELNDAYINTDNTSGKYLLYKQEALEMYISPTSSGTLYGRIRYNYPTVAAVNGGNDTVDATNHTVNLPAGVAAENLLMVMFVTDSTSTITFPAGWTQLYQTGDGAEVNTGVWYKISDGTEGATITVTTSNAQMTAHTSYRITGQFLLPENTTAVAGLSNIPDPPNITASWGTDTNLFIAVAGYDLGSVTVNAYPAGYGGGRNDRSNNAGGVGVGSAYIAATAAANNPGTFTLSAGEQWVANTIVIRGGPGVVYSGLTTGEHDITLSADTSNITMSIDGTNVDTTALNGCSVPNNANNWYLCYGNTVNYIDQIDMVIAGVTQGTWSWAYAATFTDQSGHNHTGTPTFRTTCSDPDVTLSLTSFSPVTEASADYDPDLDWPSIITTTPAKPGTMYTENSTPGVFFAPFIHAVWPLSGVPESFFWYNFTFITVIAAGILSFRIHPSLLLKIIVAMAIMIFWALPGPNVYGMFVVIYKGLYCFGVLVLSKHYGW